MFITVIVWHSAQQPVKHDTSEATRGESLCVRNKTTAALWSSDIHESLRPRDTTAFLTTDPSTYNHQTHTHVSLTHTVRFRMIWLHVRRLTQTGWWNQVFPATKTNTIKTLVMNEVFFCSEHVKPAENMSRPYFKLN